MMDADGDDDTYASDLDTIIQTSVRVCRAINRDVKHQEPLRRAGGFGQYYK